MLIIPPPQYRKRAAKPKATVQPTPAGPPVLVAAVLAPDYASLTLTFDRAIDISAYDGGSAYVNVPATNSMYQPDTEIVQVDAKTLRASLDYFDPSTGSQTTLTVNEPSGIVAVDGGAAWAGCADLLLPFP